MNNVEIKCLCGSVNVKLTGDPVVQTYCHCQDCQAAHSAAYVSTAAYPASAVEVVKGEPASLVIKTSPRMRCQHCGTFLFTEVEVAGLRSVNASLLPQGHFKPQLHLNCADAVLPVIDNLPHYKDLPAAFGGSDELVEW